MTQYLLSIEGTGGETPPPEVLDPIMRNLGVLNTEMRDAGIWVFAGALHEPSTATVVRSRDGDTLLTDGHYTEPPSPGSGTSADHRMITAQRIPPTPGTPAPSTAAR
jgi:hypothetical protein